MFFNKRVSIHWRATDSVVNPSWRFNESPRMLYINTSKLKIAVKNRRSIITILKAEAVYIQALMHAYRPKTGLKISCDSPLNCELNPVYVFINWKPIFLYFWTYSYIRTLDSSLI
jgi:hypothetical protein